MDTRDVVTLISALIVAAGWFVNSELNRRKDIAQERLKQRLAALTSFLPVFVAIKPGTAPFTNPQFVKDLENCFIHFQLFGTSSELKKMTDFVNAVNSGNLAVAQQAYQILASSIPVSVRKELGIRD